MEKGGVDTLEVFAPRGKGRVRIGRFLGTGGFQALLLPPGADIVALVKPQFEAGRNEVGKHGLVADPVVHDAVLARVTEAAIAAGLRRAAMSPSTITGATGNQEFFLHLRKVE